MIIDLGSKDKHFILGDTPYDFYKQSNNHKNSIESWVTEFFSTGGHKSVVYSDISNYAKKLDDNGMRGICCVYYDDTIAICVLFMSYHKNDKGSKISKGNINNLYSKAKSIGREIDMKSEKDLEEFVNSAKRDNERRVFTN